MKAQITLEYLFALGMGTLFFIIMVLYFSSQIADATAEKRTDAVIDVAQSLKIELDTAATVHNGYSRTLRLPEKVAGATYSIDIQRKELTVTTADLEYTVFVPDVRGNFSIGINTIERVDDVISIF